MIQINQTVTPYNILTNLTGHDIHCGVKTRDIEKLLVADGWYQVVSKGGHRQFKHPDKPGRVTVPYHGGNADLPSFVVDSILKQAGIK
jgi:predicted RNA binding protein YcfA (HicA-like mRNA interferase family)